MKNKQLDLADRTDVKTKRNSPEPKKFSRPDLWSACCPWRIAVDYSDDTPSMTRTEFTDECDVNQIMKNFEATGVLPNNGREPLYWDASAVPNNLQDAMAAMMYADTLFMQLGAPIRKEFDNDAKKFVDFALKPENKPKLKEWGLTAPETPPSAPVRVEVVTPNPPPVTPSGGLPPANA